MATKDELKINVENAKEALQHAEKLLLDFNSLPENNEFATMEEAEGVIEDRLMDRAHEDCEGSHNCGEDEYMQEFIVAGVHYIGKLTCEYNRHDKTFYYVDEHEFTVTPKS